MARWVQALLIIAIKIQYWKTYNPETRSASIKLNHAERDNYYFKASYFEIIFVLEREVILCTLLGEMILMHCWRVYQCRKGSHLVQ